MHPTNDAFYGEDRVTTSARILEAAKAAPQKMLVVKLSLNYLLLVVILMIMLIFVAGYKANINI